MSSWKKTIILRLSKRFEDYIHRMEVIEFWVARDLQRMLSYDGWENFFHAVEKAKIACKNSGCEKNDHFRYAKKMVLLGSGAKREVEDIMLTRYACYLIA